MAHFEALRSSFMDLSEMLQGQGVLDSTAIGHLYQLHFGPAAFLTPRAKSRPQYDEQSYPSLFNCLEVLPNGQPIEFHNLPLPWNNWEAVNAALENNPLAKVLMGFIWKQGDIKTLRHVFRGIHGEENGEDDSVVMYQFGRHLANPAQQPIFDQHTYRAFRLVEVIELWGNRQNLSLLFVQQTGFNRGNTLPHGALEHYLAWWNQRIATRFPQPAEERLAVLSAMDRLLFSLGKAAKLQANL
jgi:hypothetical protein